jgi:hypothetical protein
MVQDFQLMQGLAKEHSVKETKTMPEAFVEIL